MAEFLATYDLTLEGPEAYQLLGAALLELKAKRVLQSAWWITGDWDCRSLTNHLLQFIDANDRLLVVCSAEPAYYYNLMAEI